MLSFLYALGFMGRGADVIVWNVLGTKGQFFVSSFYRSLVGEVTGISLEECLCVGCSI